MSQGASLLGGALPGGAIISAAISNANGGATIWEIKVTGNEFQIPSNLPNGIYELTVKLDAGSKDAAKKQIQFGIALADGVYQVNSSRISN